MIDFNHSFKTKGRLNSRTKFLRFEFPSFTTLWLAVRTSLIYGPLAYKQVAKITFTHNGKTAITVKKKENILEYISCLCPFLAALCNGVRPRSSRAFTSDMRFARASTCLDEAFSAARWSGVLLLSSLKPKRFCLDKTSSKIYKHESVCQSQCHLLFLMHLQPNLY